MSSSWCIDLRSTGGKIEEEIAEMLDFTGGSGASH